MIPAEMHDHAAILITGANGFIGRAVVRLLQNSNQKLVLLDHHSASAPAVSTFATTFACDIADPLHLRRIFEAERIASIIHLAAILPTAASKDPSRATRVNVLGSLNLLEMAREFRIPRFVFGSSLSVYGTCRIDQVVNENFRAAPEDVYGAAKLYVEQIGRAYANLNGLEFVSLRIGRVIGAGAQSTTSAWRSQIFELLRNHRPATIHIPCPATERLLLAHVNDVARALLQLLRAPRPEHDVYNAPCESVLVSDLKERVEGLNSAITVKLGDSPAIGNPRLVDFSRFRGELGFELFPICDQLQKATAG